MKARCENCSKVFELDKIIFPLSEMSDLVKRIEPGGIVPFGECPECDALVYLVPENVTVRFGTDGTYTETYEFGSDAERDGFLNGLNECDGWLESEVIEAD